jgi:hypothetical protein
MKDGECIHTCTYVHGFDGNSALNRAQARASEGRAEAIEAIALGFIALIVPNV